MKYLFLFLCLLSAFPLLAQPLIQKGLVRELNSGKQPISAVEIIFEGASTTYSDGVGNFRLAFQDKQPGDLIFKESIRKKGYELVNEKEFEIVKISNSERLGVDIILAKAGTVDAAKKEYYDVSDAALLASFDREKRALRKKLQDAQINQEKYLNELKAINEQYDIQKATLDELSEKFARVNFDDVEAYYEEALKLFKAGKIDEAIQTLEGADPTKRTQQILAEEKRIKKAYEELDSQRVALAREKKKQIEAVRLLADMYSLKFDPVKAEQQYDQLVQLDSTDLEILSDAADFYREQHRYEKALALYPKVIKHFNAEVWQKANAYSFIGDIHTNTGSLENAMKAYMVSYQAYDTLLQKNSSYSFYKNELAISCSRLGDTYRSLGDLDSALYYYRNYNDLKKELYVSYPSNVRFKNGLAISYSKLGDTYKSMGDLDSALYYYRNSNDLEKELYASYPSNVRFKNGLAISYEKLGEIYSSRGDLDSALYYFENCKALEKELYASYPSNVRFKNGLSISYSKLGDTYRSLGDLDSALYYYQNYKALEKELYASYPSNVRFKNGLSISYSKLGNTYSFLGDLDSTLYYFRNYNNLKKELYASYPNNMSYKNGLAISYERLGETYRSMGKLDSALYYFEIETGLFEELYDSYPSNVRFKNGLAISYSKLGDTYKSMGDLDSALYYYRNYNDLEKKLYASYPSNVRFKNGLAISYSKLGDTYKSMGNLDSALYYFRNYKTMEKELYRAYPSNVEYKNALAISYYKLGDIYIKRINIEKARNYYQQAKALWEVLSQDFPKYIEFQNNLRFIENELSKIAGVTSEDIIVYQKILQIQPLEKQIAIEKDPTKKVAMQQQVVDSLTQIYQAYPDNPQIIPRLANAYGSLAWYYLFNQQFEAAGQAARKGMEIDETQEWINTNLALSLLYQGKFGEAKAIYEKLKDQPYNNGTYKSVFLEDLQALEEAGITHKDVAKIRALLKND